MIQTLGLWRTSKEQSKEEEQKKKREERKERVVEIGVNDIGLKVKKETIKGGETKEDERKRGQVIESMKHQTESDGESD